MAAHLMSSSPQPCFIRPKLCFKNRKQKKEHFIKKIQIPSCFRKKISNMESTFLHVSSVTVVWNWVGLPDLEGTMDSPGQTQTLHRPLAFPDFGV